MDERLIIKAFEKASEIAGSSTCNVRHVGSVLVLADGHAYAAANAKENCIAQGPDFCTRDSSVGDLEYLTCPSPCSEGAVIAGALFDELDVRNGTVVSTDFPCGRCRSILIDYRIGELYFANFKDGEPRMRDMFYATQMVHAGMRVGRIVQDGTDYSITPLDVSAFSSLASTAIRTPGEHYIRLMTDTEYRTAYAAITSDMKERSALIQVGRRGIAARPLL